MLEREPLQLDMQDDELSVSDILLESVHTSCLICRSRHEAISGPETREPWHPAIIKQAV